MCKRIAAFILAFLLIFSATPVSAQTATPPPGPVYIVQAGDTLWDIASRFNVSVADIEAINNMTSQDIFVGDKLIIPGLAGLSGTLITQAGAFWRDPAQPEPPIPDGPGHPATNLTTSSAQPNSMPVTN